MRDRPLLRVALVAPILVAVLPVISAVGQIGGLNIDAHHPPVAALPILVNDGDSLSTTSGSSLSITFPQYGVSGLKVPSPINAYNVAVTGETIDTMIANFATNVTPLYQSNVPFVVALLGGGNNIRASQTGVSVLAKLQTYVNLVHALGPNARIVVGSYPLQCDIQADVSKNPQMQILNAGIQTGWNVPQTSGGLGADGLADFFANPTVGMNTYASSAFCNQQYSDDGQHGTDLTKSILGPIQAAAVQPLLLPSVFPLPGIAGDTAGTDCYASTGQYYPSATRCALNVSRITTNGTASNLLPTSPAGYAYSTFANNVARLTYGPGLGVMYEEGRSNFLLNSTAPATQTTGTLANGTYTLWYNGAGTATMSSGSATGCGTGAASQGNPISFTLTGTTGNCVVTVTGAGLADQFQLELNSGTISAPTSLIVTTAAVGVRANERITLANLPPFCTSSSYSTFFAGTPFMPTTFANGQGGIDINNGLSNGRSELDRQAAGGNPSALGASPASGTYLNINWAPAWATGAYGKLAGAWAANDQAFSFDGGTVQTNATGAPLAAPAITGVIIGAANTGTIRFFNGYISRFAIWGCTRQPNSNLQAVSTIGQYD